MTDIEITVVDRGRLTCDWNFLVEGHTMATADEPDPSPQYDEIPVWNLIVDHPEATILWDTGVHHRANDGYWAEPMFQTFAAHDADEHRLDDDLEQVGYTVDGIDVVVQGHLHSDHAGGLHHFDGTDTPVYVHEAELKFAYFSEKTRHGSHGYELKDFDHDLNWRVLTQEREHHFEGIEFVHLPGHTPGLVGMVVEVGDESVIFTNDQVYVETNYEYEVPLGAGLVWNRQHWLESLHRVKDMARRRDATVVFGHDPEQFEDICKAWP